CDFIVKVVDVYPTEFPDNSPNPENVRMGGFEQLVRGEPLRAKFRNGLEKAEPMQPGKLTQITFDMPDICHVFRAGHKLMIQVQSSWFPLLDRNPQTFVDIPDAKPADFRPATQRLSRSHGAASSVAVPILNAD
ncbi:MAG TPA: CocE/NonD family hydrolase C-terminal non-catalytic domain-containing protein, partial [Lacipirellulaceae bacterium]|nr:CocE/NonD family hydrolase C-terminal non-catalytic domain-containing protein [Lacipirellulaceae bacterium]